MTVLNKVDLKREGEYVACAAVDTKNNTYYNRSCAGDCSACAAGGSVCAD
jgi:hypothetical protein